MRHQDALAIARGRGRDSGFYFDFDGTLSDICLEPAAATPVPGAARALQDLAEVAGRVGIVSARPVEFLEPHFSGVALYGLYGLERRIPGKGPESATPATAGPGGGAGPIKIEIDPAALEWLPVVEEAINAARAELPGDLLVEDKRLAMAVHYRSAPELGERVREWAADRAGRTGLRLQEGRMVAELKPPVDRDKGDVVREAAGGLAALWYAGDDIADLLAFEALTEAETAGDGVTGDRFTGVRVAVENGETDALTSAADLVVPSPTALVELVEELTSVMS